MPVFRIHKTNNYTVMSNAHLQDKSLSLKAKGLLSVMLSLPEDWEYSILGLVALSKDGKDAIMSTINELVEAGYINITKARSDDGRFAFEYDIYETPMRENRCGKSESVNPPLYNTNNKELNTNTPISISTPYVVDTLMSPKGEGRESYATTEVSHEELLFDDFRRAYRGTKRGLATEFANFKKKHSDWKQVVSILKSSYEHQCFLKDEARQRGCFVAQEKNLQTYINQRCWEEEPQFSEPNKPHEKNFLEKMRRSDEIYRTLKNLENG